MMKEMITKSDFLFTIGSNNFFSPSTTYNTLSICPYELTTLLSDPIKLLICSQNLHSVSQKR
jgi:hypothetical protein